MSSDNKLKIFLVDDDPFCRNVYRQHLSGIGCSDIVDFSNGSDCLNALAQHPNVIFLDHGMDHLTGLEVLKKIKHSNPDTYVVLLSGQANVTTAVKALKLGAIDYIVKGINDLENITKVLNKIGALIVHRNIKRLLTYQK